MSGERQRWNSPCDEWIFLSYGQVAAQKTNPPHPRIAYPMKGISVAPGIAAPRPWRCRSGRPPGRRRGITRNPWRRGASPRLRSWRPSREISAQDPGWRRRPGRGTAVVAGCGGVCACVAPFRSDRLHRGETGFSDDQRIFRISGLICPGTPCPNSRKSASGLRRDHQSRMRPGLRGVVK